MNGSKEREMLASSAEESGRRSERSREVRGGVQIEEERDMRIDMLVMEC